MLEVQLVRRSRNGVAIPVARSGSRALVSSVAEAILAEMDRWRFEDEVLNDVAAQERRALRRLLRREGVRHAC